jgi:predicted enzyme related to lactoylglutathione lyase
MHRSKLAGFIIDCQTDDLPAAAEFWGAALGMGVRSLPAAEGEKYVRLLDPNEHLHVEVQKVDHPSRVHLDIETDDIEAEVARLQQLGARPLARVQGWCVMEAPTGQRFCVVRPTSKRFEDEANEWA